MALISTRCQECLSLWRLEGASLNEETSRVYFSGGDTACILRKAIYGLKQSPRAWFDEFSIVIFSIGFAHCHSDHSMFVRRTKSGSVILAVYVNDILLIGGDSMALAEIKEYLKRYFMTKDMGKPRNFLGIQVAY